MKTYTICLILALCCIFPHETADKKDSLIKKYEQEETNRIIEAAESMRYLIEMQGGAAL